MCGINGGIVNIDIDRKFIEKSLMMIEHRGPDNMNIFKRQGAFLGIRRLAIIDIQGGNQPVFNEDETVAVVFNGEIYNYIELSQELVRKGHNFASSSDTEVIVHLYEEYGKFFCNYLRGMFAFTILDMKNNSLFMARDRFGKKPLFYAMTREMGLIFASELKALKILMEILEYPIEIKNQSIYDYLSFGFIPQPETIYKGVYSVPPASWTYFDNKGIESAVYWKLEYLPKYIAREDEICEEVGRLIGEAVKLRLRSDVPLGLFLSGGIDSSVIAYEAAQVVGERLQSFTVSVSDPLLDESEIASQTAIKLGIRNEILRLDFAPQNILEKVIYFYDQPYADSSAIPSLEIARLARQHVKVILTGDGGDEIFAGYRRDMASRYMKYLQIYPNLSFKSLNMLTEIIENERRSFFGFLSRFTRGLVLNRAGRYVAWTSDMFGEKEKKEYWNGKKIINTECLIESEFCDEYSDLDGQLYMDIKLNLLSDLLVKMDIATMANSIEARSPMLDHVLAEFVARLPDNNKIAFGCTKKLLRKAYRNKLPDSVIDGTKKGFEIPLEKWLKDDLKEMLLDTVGAKDARVKDFIDYGFINDFINKKEMRDRNWAAITYAMLVLELWLRAN